MKYLIFSDESGKWNEGNYYIRSWLRITPENYDLLRKEILFAKHELGMKELKWSGFRRNYEKFKNIFSVGFDIFITISRPIHFQSIEYNIINSIKSIPISTGGQKLTDKIKKKIINSAKNELFLNYFEKRHIEKSKKALVPEKDSLEYKYIIDTPQYLDKEWESIANECGIQQMDVIKDSASNPGIEIADVISGCIMDSLEKKNNKARIYYEECIKNKMLNMKSKTSCNPNLIFFHGFTDKEKEDMNIFR